MVAAYALKRKAVLLLPYAIILTAADIFEKMRKKTLTTTKKKLSQTILRLAV